MNIPVFEKITFDKVDTSHLKERCIETKIGSMPVYIDVPNGQSELFLNNFQSVLAELNIHPFFPYPIYFVTTEISHHPSLAIVQDKSEIPDFFPLKMHSRGRSRFDGKNRTIVQKLISSDLYNRHQILKIFAIKHKMVFNNSKEIDFYHKILESHYE